MYINLYPQYDAQAQALDAAFKEIVRATNARDDLSPKGKQDAISAAIQPPSELPTRST